MFTHDQLMPQLEGLRRFSMKLTSNRPDSDDLLQSTVLRAIEKQHLFEDGTNLFHWTSRIMFNIFVSNYKRRTQRECQFDPEALIASLSVMPDQESRMHFKSVCGAIEKLSPQHREIITVICWDGLSYEEAAQKLGIAIGTVRSRLARAREKLMERLGDVPEGTTIQ